MATQVEIEKLPGKYTDRTLLVSMDLPEASRRYVEILREIHRNVNLRSSKVINNAIWRYEQFWLPLVAKTQRKTEWNAVKKTQILPPLDVYWIWICHMLCPRHYQMDCNTLVYSVPDHSLLAEPERHKATSKSRELWDKHYPDQPFNSSGQTNSGLLDNYHSQCHYYDLKEASTTQLPFYFQVSLLHYRKYQFLTASFERYKKFLFLKKDKPGLFIVPTYDIELMWHAHLLHPVLYGVDMSRTLGSPLAHDNMVTNPAPMGNKLSLSDVDAQARALWKRWQGEDFDAPGTWHRQELPSSILKMLTREENDQVATKISQMRITNIVINGLDDEGKYIFKIGRIGEGTRRVIFSRSAVAEKFLQATEKPAQFDFHNGKHNSLVCVLTHNSRGILAKTMRKAVEEVILGHVLQDTVDQHTKLYNLQLAALGRHGNNNDNWTVNFQLSMTKPTRGIYILVPEVSAFARRRLSDRGDEDIPGVWDTIPLPQSTLRNARDCLIADHRLFNHLDEHHFTCRVMHFFRDETSAVQVFYKDEISAVSYLVGLGTLPSPIQVASRECPTIDQELGEKAMLIRDMDGDWGVVIGCWKPVPSDTWKRHKMVEQKGCGYFSVRFFHLRHHTWEQKAAMPSYRDSSGGMMDIKLEKISIDFEGNTITMSEDCEETAQNLCLAFSLFVLMVMTLPESICGFMLPRIKGKKKRGRKNSKRNNDDPRPHLIEEVLLIQAGGPGMVPQLNMAADEDDHSLEEFTTGQFAIDTPEQIPEEENKMEEYDASDSDDDSMDHPTNDMASMVTDDESKQRYSFFIPLD